MAGASDSLVLIFRKRWLNTHLLTLLNVTCICMAGDVQPHAAGRLNNRWQSMCWHIASSTCCVVTVVALYTVLDVESCHRKLHLSTLPIVLYAVKMLSACACSMALSSYIAPSVVLPAIREQWNLRRIEGCMPPASRSVAEADARRRPVHIWDPEAASFCATSL